MDREILEQIDEGLQTVLSNQQVKGIPGTANGVPGISKEPIYFSFYDGSFSIFFYACASQFYDAFFFYHKAYFVNVFI